MPTHVCPHCQALFWFDERINRNKSKKKIVYTLCCQEGKVNLPLLAKTPSPLNELLDVHGGAVSKHFRANIRSYNAVFSWTSFGAKFDPRLLNSRGPYSLILCGENYHYMGSLLPVEGKKPRYSQLYVHDPTSEVDDRISQFTSPETKLRRELVQSLQDMLDVHNVLARSFRQVRCSLQQPANRQLNLRISGSRVANGRQYELPSGTELAGLIPGDFEPDREDRDIIVNNSNTGLTRITSLNPLFDSLHFPLLFPHGDDGFHTNIAYDPAHVPPKTKRQFVTQREYYCFRIQYRTSEGKTLIRAGKALQHYCIDAFTTVEQNRLTYLRNNQKTLRSETYNELYNAFTRGESDSRNLGRIILPSTFTGSVRYMKQLFLDGMAICHYFGNPDLFITFTSNAQWPEITNAFIQDVGPCGEDKPSVVVRVFRMKLLHLKDDINKQRIFGRTVAGMHTVEFQKRGLPHVHILVWLAKEAAIDTTAQIDTFISAELPDPMIDPIGYAAATKFMLHGPCGVDFQKSPCMVDDKCKKFFPKAYTSETTIDDHGYAVYRRRMTGITAIKSGVSLDNRYVVPYNRYLIVKYQAHINIEVCHKVDEIAQYLDCRSISSYEAVWRLLSFQIHERDPNVVRLSIHLPNQQPISYDAAQPVHSIVARPSCTNTMLTQWFLLNQRYPSARNLTYDRIPNSFVWSDQCKDWSPRKNGFALGRIPSVPAACGDVFYLRILLGKIPGALSFQHLRTVSGVVYSDYQLACQAMGLLATDNEWDSVMLEVSRWGQEQLTSAPLQQPSSPTLYNQVLHALNSILHTYSSSLGHFGLPMPTAGTSCMQATNIITAHLNYNCATEAAKSHQLHSSLNGSQLTAYAAIIESVSKNQGKFFFLHGHGGTGKTFLYNCIISKIRSEGKIVLVVASSGIAATLLPDGVTAHSRFKIPLEVDNLSTCMVKKGTEVAELLKEATLIVWDEAPMVHRLSFEAVDRTLCDLMNTPLSGPQYSPFGGKTVLLGGDFRQTLPVVPKGSREDNINASLPRSYLWNFCTLLHLHINMRINSLPINTLPIFGGMQFSDWVLAIGNGTLPAETFLPSIAADWITVPRKFLIQSKHNAIEQLITRVYPSFQQSYQSLEYIKARAIVTPTNAVVSEINNLLLDQIPGSSKKYFSADSLSTTNSNTATLQLEYPLEFLNSLSFNGVPEHILDLKPYVTVMLLRNINPAAGMCNGTRILLTHLGDYVLRGLIVGGNLEGTIVAIPRIVLDVTDTKWPFTLKRRQFPIRICYAMTINKSQGQTLDHVGLYLPKPVFSHGQLYVAVSRVRSADGLHVLIQNPQSMPEDTTRNIVYHEVLAEIPTA
ncbi:ATP-dependent DNA helicase PIF1 [Linum perenne]